MNHGTIAASGQFSLEKDFFFHARQMEKRARRVIALEATYARVSSNL